MTRAPRRSLLGSVSAAACVAACVALSSAAGAQASRTLDGDEITVRAAGVNGAMECPCSSDVLRIPHDRKLYIVGIGIRHPLYGHRDSGIQLEYAFELLPLIVSRGTADERFTVELCSSGYCAISASPYPWTTTSVGAGVLPLGFVAGVPIASWLRLNLRTAGGIVRLSRPVPILQGRKLNFLAEGAASTEVRLVGDLSLSAGVVINHISNGFTATINPGMNSRMIQVGLVGKR
jgi:hypothetical protein